MNPWRKRAGSGSFRLLVSIVLIAAGGRRAPAETRKLEPPQREKVEKAVAAFMEEKKVPGVALAVVLGRSLVWSAGFGFADMEDRAPARAETRFRLGSISKSLTATALLQLWERGKLDLDAPVQTYCPAFPKKEWPISSRQLLAHLGGIRHYREDGKGDVAPDSARHFATMEQSLELFAGDPLVSKPGAEFHYSTYGYTLLGCVLEGAASAKFMDYLKVSVLTPAGMEATGEDNFFAVIPNRTRWYHREPDGAVRNAGVLDSSYKIPGGGLLSSADDLARFEIALLENRLLRPATRELMWTEVRPGDGKPSHYGLGWFVDDSSGRRTVGHSGGQQGTDTMLLLAPELGAGVVVLANMDNVNTTPLAKQILDLLLAEPGKQP